ncbi:MAG TPA: phosphopantetheine-binding protein [Spirochaetota bacterium]|nr:phosphopantetheine-binding protein [Spirochaetota bacterium]
MTKDEVFVVLKKFILEQLDDEVTESDITPEKSMVDIGANSLDIVEIVSNTMRELNSKVPRDELAKAGTMGELSVKIAEYAEK